MWERWEGRGIRCAKKQQESEENDTAKSTDAFADEARINGKKGVTGPTITTVGLKGA